ncbi:YbaB/EbfC family nucleoid-associated protein [Actinoplanes sp. KI2]|uniref:YbaB/EbfC family nucleoid-associated protein n=1 Tax=Actinoplanes sp. KI2 TaxID=2983315 RepID=UPI0021D600C7|nr:YbaB/EbfC family nucleoid-associated protein [Actinoplanes sp. KI2]MCU7724310.1 YbaB/EbfC family nucleoid-associated protein [Actinoplanes sp. KI2]
MTDDAIDGLALEKIDRWQRGFEERAAQARALNELTSELSATAREGHGAVEVTVGSDGQITRLWLDEEIRRQPAETTARQIMAAVRAAKESLVRDFARATAETVGLDSATGQAVMRSVNARLGRPDPESDGRDQAQ